MDIFLILTTHLIIPVTIILQSHHCLPITSRATRLLSLLALLSDYHQSSTPGNYGPVTPLSTSKQLTTPTTASADTAHPSLSAIKQTGSSTPGSTGDYCPPIIPLSTTKQPVTPSTMSAANKPLLQKKNKPQEREAKKAEHQNKAQEKAREKSARQLT